MRRGEKGVLRGMFATSDDSSDDESISSNSYDNIDVLQCLREQIEDTGIIYYESPISGIRITLRQNKLMGIAHQLWPAAKLLCQFLESHKIDFFSHPASSVIELGAGIGLCGLYSAVALGSQKVIMTDLEEAMDILTENILINSTLLECCDEGKEVRAVVEPCVLRWGEFGDLAHILRKYFGVATVSANSNVMDSIVSTSPPNANLTSISHFPTPDTLLTTTTLGIEYTNIFAPAPPPLVIAADCVYWECLFDPFFKTVSQLVRLDCIIIIAHVKRWKKDEKFFNMCKKSDFMEISVLQETVEYLDDENTGNNFPKPM